VTVPVEGAVLPVDKPVGPTSHDIVQRARRVLRVRRVGHTGTLDPFASGLMLLCVGPATRLSEYLTGQDKEYLATARLGVSTDTLDREGQAVAESDAWRQVTLGAVEGALATLRGTIEQRPPVFSAKKVQGEAAHRRSRRGEKVSLPAVRVVIHELELTELALPEIGFRVVCSSGTYIRSLARDVGEALGVGAHLVALRRTRVGAHRVEDAVPGDFREPIPAGSWITPLDALGGWTRLEVDEAEAARICHGQSLSTVGDGDPEGPAPGPVALHFRGHLLSVAHVEGGVIRPEKVFPHALEAAS
jgi:tRNA pseudouridine55 synthase